MAIIPENEFVGKINAADSNYDLGSARDIITKGDKTGTPWKARLINDIWGFLQKLLNNAGITPSGSPDTILASDYFDGLMSVVTRPTPTTITMAALTGVKVGHVIRTAGFSTGSGGGGTYDAVVTGTTPNVDLPNTFNIIISVADPLISFSLRIVRVRVKQFGATGDGTTDDTNAIKQAHVFAKGQEVLYEKGHYRITDNIDDGVTPIRIKGVAGSWQHNHIVDNFSPGFSIDTDDLDDLIDQAAVIFCDNCSLVGSIDTPGNFNAFLFLKTLRDIAVYGDNGAEIGVHIRPLATEISGCFFSHFEWFGVCTRSGITFSHYNCGYDTNGHGLAETGTAENSPDYGSGCNLKIGSSKTPEDYHGIVSNDRPTTFGIGDLFMWATNSYVQDGISGFRGMQVHGLISGTFDRVGSYQGQYFATCEDVTLESPYVENYAHDGLVASDGLPIGIYQTNSRLTVIQDSLRNLGFGGPVVFTDITNFVGTFGVLMNRMKATTYTVLTKLGIGVDDPDEEIEVLASSTPFIKLSSDDNSGAFFQANNGSKKYSWGVDTTSTNDLLIRDSSLGANLITFNNGANLRPGTDNLQNLGGGSLRWKEIFAGNATINTSDGRLKTKVRILNKAEKAVAVKLKSMLRMFKYIDSVDEKGEGARIHCGLIAQDVEKAFYDEGLDAYKYSMFCYDEWDDSYEQDRDGDDKPILNEDGTPKLKLAIGAGNRFGIRYSQVLAFIISAL